MTEIITGKENIKGKKMSIKSEDYMRIGREIMDQTNREIYSKPRRKQRHLPGNENRQRRQHGSSRAKTDDPAAVEGGQRW